jgi:hypothetical protein
MDVHCSTCSEPWDTHHLMHDEIFDTDLGEEEAIAWMDLPQSEKLSPWYRAKFKANGWMFGSSVLNVIRCPACPKDAQADPEKTAIKAVLEEMLGDDEDALAAILEDYEL